MNNFFAWFWTVMVFLSIAWYATLVFYVGTKGAREIRQMARNLSESQDAD